MFLFPIQEQNNSSKLSPREYIWFNLDLEKTSPNSKIIIKVQNSARNTTLNNVFLREHTSRWSPIKSWEEENIQEMLLVTSYYKKYYLHRTIHICGKESTACAPVGIELRYRHVSSVSYLIMVCPNRSETCTYFSEESFINIHLSKQVCEHWRTLKRLQT